MAMNGVNKLSEINLNLAMFNWDNDKSSKKLNIDDDYLTIRVKDGSGFKTSLGDQVNNLLN